MQISVLPDENKKEYVSDLHWFVNEGTTRDPIPDDHLLPQRLYYVFSWTGLGPSMLKVEGGTVREVFDLLYALPLPPSTQFVRRRYGPGDVIIAIEKAPHPVTTYGEAIDLWGIWIAEEEYWEYPDSVFFYVDWWKEPVKVYPNPEDKGRCKLIKPPPHEKWLEYGYER